MRAHKIEYIDQEDIDLTILIDNSGTKKDKDKIIYLFKKYIDATTHICKSCGSEIIMMWQKYKYYYDLYLVDNQIDKK